ncbi:MAG: AbrB/MazE/SpoVT family DNA-binding domain-containing protein [Candidatus Altiarchaeota archaeon]
MYVELTKISSRGQVVIPQRIREKLGLAEGMPLAVAEQGNVILLQKMEFPKFNLKSMLSESHKFAKEKGIQSSGLEETINKVRNRK